MTKYWPLPLAVFALWPTNSPSSYSGSNLGLSNSVVILKRKKRVKTEAEDKAIAELIFYNIPNNLLPLGTTYSPPWLRAAGEPVYQSVLGDRLEYKLTFNNYACVHQLAPATPSATPVWHGPSPQAGPDDLEAVRWLPGDTLRLHTPQPDYLGH